MKARLFSFLLFAVVSLGMLGYNPATSQAQTGTATATPTLQPTAAIDVKDTWNLAAIYPDDAAWEKDFQLVKETYLPQYKNYEGKLGDTAQLAQLLDMDEKASRTISKLYVYAFMRRDEDNTNSKVSEMADRSGSLYTDLSAAGSFVRPELLALDQKVLEGYMADARFKDYDIFFQYLLDDKAHTLNPSEEKLLAMTGDMSGAPSTISTKIREADLTFPKIKDPEGKEIQLSEAVYGDLMLDPNRDFRAQVYRQMLGTYGGMKNSLAAALDAQMRTDMFFARARKYDSALDASLQSNHIPSQVYTALVKATNDNLNSLQRYVSLRRQVMALDKVRAYDLFVPLVQTQDIKIPYPEAQAKVAQALAPLGNQYIADLNKAFASRWVDVYERPHKTSGGYTWGSYDTHPYVLLNYNDSLDSLLTLGHEMGHAMNAYYANQAQPYVKSGTPTFNAEVASTTNEMLVLRYLIQNAKSDEEKLYYLDRLAETIRGTFFAQVMFAEFEQQIHERVEKGNALSVDSLNDLWGKILVKYYGADFELTDDAKLGWSRIPHFYMSFYVYQYSTGIAAADQFSADLSAGQAGAADKYLAYLKAGGSDYPVTVLKTAGVDMLSGKPIDTLLTDFNSTVDEMEKLLVKLGKIKR